MSTAQNGDDKQWRQRYLKQVDDNENLSERYREHVELLQRIVSRLCLSVDESNPEFHSEIRDLRRKLKGELSSLPSLAESLAEIDRRFLADRSDEHLRVSLPESTGTNLHKPSVFEKGKHWVEGVFNKMKGQYHSETIETRIEVVPDDFVELPGADKLKEVLESTPGYGAIASKVADILNALLSQLSYPESAQQDLQALRLRIASRVNWYELPPTLEDLSNLIIASMGKGQRQFDTFLHELDQQLQVMTDFLSGHDERDQTWLDLSKQLEQSVNEKRIALELNADGQPNPELEKQLKDSIREHLEDISDIAVEFVKRGEKLSAGFQPELEAVQQGVQSLLLEQKKLRSQLEEERHSALEDVLTGLASREAYDERLEFEYLRWQRYKKPVALCAADIDHFDSINERYGHLSGDRTLQIIGKELKERMRKTDFVARYGGEKFIFILPVTKIDVAEQVMEKLRKTIMSLPLHFRAQRVKLTVSFGLVEFHECAHFSELSVKADQALAQAKRQGRNQVCVWHAEADKKNSEE